LEKRERCGIGPQITDREYLRRDDALGPSAGRGVKSRPMRSAAKPLWRAATPRSEHPFAPEAPGHGSSHASTRHGSLGLRRHVCREPVRVLIVAVCSERAIQRGRRSIRRLCRLFNLFKMFKRSVSYKVLNILNILNSAWKRRGVLRSVAV
jgi:hypothetical protein